MRQDLSALQGHGQCDPPQTPVQVLVEKLHATSYGNIVENRMRHRTVTSYVFCDVDARYRIIATRHTIWTYDIV